jgi:hypothetical protein
MNYYYCLLYVGLVKKKQLEHVVQFRMSHLIQICIVVILKSEHMRLLMGWPFWRF